MRCHIFQLAKGRDWIAQEPHRPFVMFGDDGLWEDSPVCAADLERVEVAAESVTDYASKAWSCGIQHFFLVCVDGVLLCKVRETAAWWCPRKSIRLIELFLDTHAGNRRAAPAQLPLL